MPEGRELLTRSLAGERTDRQPAVLHGWGDYKVELAGIHPKFQNFLGGPELAGAERAFYQRFGSDWIHLGSGVSRGWWERSRKVEGERDLVLPG